LAGLLGIGSAALYWPGFRFPADNLCEYLASRADSFKLGQCPERNGANNGDVGWTLNGGFANVPADTAQFGGNALNASAFIANDSGAALSGAYRLGKNQNICWRNNANGADICYGKNASEGLAGNNVPIVTSFAATAATTDNVNVVGMTASGHCTLTATNSGAAGGIASVFVSNKTTNQITVTHTATSGWTFDVSCTPN